METDDPIEVARRLNIASDRLNQRIIVEEELLKNRGLGIAVWVPIGGKGEFRLGYTNELGKWQLMIAQRIGDEEKKWNLSAAPRGLRLFGLKHLPQLHAALLHAADSLANRIDRFLSDGIDTDDVGGK